MTNIDPAQRTNLSAYAGAFVAPMNRRLLAAAQAKQDGQWREFHSHCSHAATDAAGIACDHAEAYATEAWEVGGVAQRAAWRASLPKVRHDATRIERDHVFALQAEAEATYAANLAASTALAMLAA